MAPATTDVTVPILTDERSRRFKVIAFAVDLTGKKLIDEIFHISAFEENGSTFDQYIMTYRDLSKSAVRTHGVRIVTMLGKYRVMKDAFSMKSIQTKSEYAALNDFLNWLAAQKGSSEAIILTYHDQGSDKVTPFLMEALERYNMTQEFFKIVKGFVNCSQIASIQPEHKGRSLALGNLARRVLGDEEKRERRVIQQLPQVSPPQQRLPVTIETKSTLEKSKSMERRREDRAARNRSIPRERGDGDRDNMMSSAKTRALTTYKLLQKLTPADTDLFNPDLANFITTQEEEINLVRRQRELAAKVRSLRPIFVNRIRINPRERSRAVLLRQYLIEVATDYDSLKNMFETQGSDGIQRLVESSSAKKKKAHQDELVQLIISHFTKKPYLENGHENLPRGDGAGDQRQPDTGTSTESDGEEYEDAHTGI